LSAIVHAVDADSGFVDRPHFIHMAVRFPAFLFLPFLLQKKLSKQGRGAREALLALKKLHFASFPMAQQHSPVRPQAATAVPVRSHHHGPMLLHEYE
jgi:hypothetical protein